jgi:hypothetical protein
LKIGIDNIFDLIHFNTNIFCSLSIFMSFQDSNKKKYDCLCGESFSSVEEYEEHFDLIIQHFI